MRAMRAPTKMMVWWPELDRVAAQEDTIADKMHIRAGGGSLLPTTFDSPQMAFEVCAASSMIHRRSLLSISARSLVDVMGISIHTAAWCNSNFVKGGRAGGWAGVLMTDSSS